MPSLLRFFHSHIVGPVVHIELKREDTNEYVEAEISKEQFTKLGLQVGEIVYVRPKRSESICAGGFCNLKCAH
ncbi:hypothetical protein GCM10020331_076280 [Ectobacillus funiculus]